LPRPHRARAGAGATRPHPLTHEKRARPEGLTLEEMGGDLLSREVALRVPSALAGLTALFGMGRGVSPPVRPPNCQGARTTAAPSKLHSDSTDVQIKTSGN